MSLFEKGREKTGGRASGTRNKFSKKFDDALLRDFEEHGEEAIKIARIERPTEYLKLIASRFPIEFQFTDSRLKELSDDELDTFIAHMRTGKLKVFKEHLDWWEEFRLYHRKDGKVVKEGDDLLCATRYALMHLRFAKTKSFSDRWRRPIEYPETRYA